LPLPWPLPNPPRARRARSNLSTDSSFSHEENPASAGFFHGAMSAEQRLDRTLTLSCLGLFRR
jgi:hypothetical protein